MDMIPGDKNLGVGGMNRKALQLPPQEEVAKSPEKTETGTTVRQGDRVEINSVLPRNEEKGVLSLNQNDLSARYGQLVAQMKGLILNTSSHALEAQAGDGLSFLKTLYQ